MADGGNWTLKEFVWEGPQQMSRNGLELHAVVAEVSGPARCNTGGPDGPDQAALPM
jgi:hypothetical protein